MIVFTKVTAFLDFCKVWQKCTDVSVESTASVFAVEDGSRKPFQNIKFLLRYNGLTSQKTDDAEAPRRETHN
jgi:hypothetical protein